MKTKLIAALIVGSFVLAGCGGGGSSDSAMDMDEPPPLTEEEERIDELEEQLEAAQEQARLEQAAREREQAAREREQAAREQAEAEQERLEDEAEEAETRANRADAKATIGGLRAAAAGTLTTVTPRYAATTDVVTDPAVSFANKSRGSASGWSVTTLSNSGFTHNDDLVVYSNRGPATRVLLTQEYSGRFMDDDDETANTPIEASITSADGRLIRSGSFPTQDGDDKTFPHNYENDGTSDGLDIVRISGTFHGASGYFHCMGECTIGRRGDRYTVAGTWTFHATDTARALVDDKSYMHFGWWKREQKSDESFSFATFSGRSAMDYSATNDATNFNLLGGSATYRGPAVGQYAIYQPLGTQSEAGSFTASAELTADFTANMLSGTVTNFSNDPDWSLTLNRQSMAGGDVSGGTTDWTIAGNTSLRRGAWDAEFFSEAEYVGQTPDGVIGEFTGIYDADADAANGDVGRIVGAFGARK